MSEIKKYVDNLAAQELVNQIQQADAEVLKAAKAHAEGLASNYDAAGAATTAETNAKKYTDDEIVKVNASIKTNKDAIDAINNTDTGILALAKADAKEKADAVDAKVTALDGKVGELPTGVDVKAKTVVEYVDEKVAKVTTDATTLTGRVDQAEKDIDAIEADYLKAADKTALEGKITTAQEKADAAQTHSEGVAANLATAKGELEKADQAQVGRISALEEKIKGVSGAMHFKGIVDELPEDKSTYVEGDVIIVGEKEYVFNGTDFAEFGDVSAEAQRLTAIEGRVDTAETDIDNLEGRMATVEGSVATKAEAQALTDETKAREDADKALDGRLKTIEGKFDGEGSVAAQIATAKQEAIDAAATDATTKANQALTDGKAYTDAEVAKDRTRLDAVEAKATKNAEDIAAFQAISVEEIKAMFVKKSE